MSNLITCVIENSKPTVRKNNWWAYYGPLRARFDAKYLVACSDDENVANDYNCDTSIITAESDRPQRQVREDALNIVTFKTQLPARVDGCSYPRHWRSLLTCFDLAKKLQCERLLTLESDSWVLTGRLADRLAKFPSGIGCPWCAVHTMAELMLAVYHRDIFDRMIAFIKRKSWEEWAKPQPENLERTLAKEFGIIPWMDLVGDRYVEREKPEQTPPADADFVIQGEGHTPLFRP
jgi:hypothetical protein